MDCVRRFKSLGDPESPAPTAPEAPAAPTVRSVGTEQNDYVTISAPASDGGSAITQYNWESNDGKSGNRDAVGEFAVEQEANTSQTYRVRAVNAVGASEWSEYSASITTPTTPPFFPPFFPPYFPYFPYFIPSDCIDDDAGFCQGNDYYQYQYSPSGQVGCPPRLAEVNAIGCRQAPPFFPYFPYFPYFPGCGVPTTYVGPSSTAPGCSDWIDNCGNLIVDC